MNYYSLMKQYESDMIDALKRFLAIPSVYEESSDKTKPFGENVDKALRYIGELGERYGFDVDYCDGYATELTIGEGKELISIFAHADVVPATGKWSHDPFDPIIKKKRIFARGSSDDKGPLIAAFYATKALRDNGLLRDYRVRIVVGGDEERGSRCLEYYFDNLKKEAPTFGFTPDSDFPLIYGEKGITDFYCSLNVNIPHVHSFKGGIVTNAVCDNVDVIMDKDDEFIAYLKENNIKFIEKENGLTFLGKSCHGSTPQLGENAALIMFKAFGDFYHINELTTLGEKLADTSGKSFNLYTLSKELGPTTYCVGIVNFSNNVLSFTVNFRYGETVDPYAYLAKFDEFFKTKSEIKNGCSKVLLYDKNSTLVKTLLKAYRLETNDFSKPLTTGGGTYAKHAPNTIAFGALFPHEKSSMHEPDESLPLDDFFMSSVIYAHAIYLLGKADED